MLIGALLLFFGAGVYIAAVLGVLALILGFAFSDRPFWLFIGQMLWNPSSNFVLVAVPLFLLMGEIMLRAGPVGEAVPRAQRAFCIACRADCCTPTSCRAACSRRSRGRASRPPRRWARSRCRTSATRATTRAGCSGSLAAGGALGNLIPPGHHVHHLRADHRHLGRQAVSRRARAERCSCWPLHRGDPSGTACGARAAARARADARRARAARAGRPRADRGADRRWCSARSTPASRRRRSRPRSASSARSSSPRSSGALLAGACCTSRRRRRRAPRR